MADVGKNVEQVGFPYTNTGNANWYIFPHFHTMPQRFSLRHVYTNDSAMEVTRYVLNRNKFKESSKTYTRLSIATVDRLAPIAWKKQKCAGKQTSDCFWNCPTQAGISIMLPQ